MTQFEYSYGPAEILGEVVAGRIRMLSDLEDGRYASALDIGRTLLGRIDGWPGWQTQQWAGQDWIPPDSGHAVLLLAQRTGLICDLALAAIGDGDSEQAEAYLAMSRVAGTPPTTATYGTAGRMDPVLNLGITMCPHGRPTLDPGGRCLMKPPCSP
ncbi:MULTISPECIES: hypothetical protein [unclassified Mycolicibacterium]|uniref:hypothetical protein n=1 Tax=unclassified Mycolicibacterium TaxID=2636767 RepID=UPI002ED7D57D